MIDYLIIGNGPAGRKAAETIRKKDSAASLALITNEPYPFYPRPQLSLGYLAGKVEKDKLFVAPDFYARNAVSLLFGDVTGALPEKNQVVVSGDFVITYRALLIASGASAAVPPWEGAGLDGVVTLRTLHDADAILARIAAEENVVVAGAGILGVEAAEALRMRGKKITLLVRGGKESVGSPALAPEAAAKRCDAMMDTGVTVMLGDEVEKFTGAGKLEAVHTKQGRCIEAGVVIVTIGAKPNTGFLKDSGIETARGVIVDSELGTNFKNVFAAGDAAEVTGEGCEKQRYGAPYVNAMKQGEYAAGKMMECVNAKT